VSPVGPSVQSVRVQRLRESEESREVIERADQVMAEVPKAVARLRLATIRYRERLGVQRKSD
jgi:hypothetical protein